MVSWHDISLILSLNFHVGDAGVIIAASRLGEGCVIDDVRHDILVAISVYTMVLDLIVLVLTAVVTHNGSAPRSRLAALIMTDGLIYFIIVFLAHMAVTLCTTLDGRPEISVTANVPAMVISTVASCRVIRNLSSQSNCAENS
ncbi:hypothetical protein HGRIS_001338 [Hohenbuehelia grisea]|uniref:Uncharacterized protein n=1 Tax=Hohenbuehelia grisea TaxID=104357 RepID=A0ABR3JR79_9AGAR